MNTIKATRFALRVFPALAALSLAGPVPAQEVGSAGAVNPASTGMPPGRPSRVLELGARVIHKERIRTTGTGSVQLIFLDKTTLNIGPNSDIVIDEFVYDPNRGSGKMAVSMAKGVLRFVGGNVSHAGNATVTTPAATLGIRGGVATIKHNPCDGSIPAFAHLECGTRAINHFGVLTVTTLSGTEVIRRAGFAVTIANPSSPPPAPTRVSQAEVDETNAQLSSKPGQSGGAREKPTEQTVARAGVGALNATITPGLIQGQQQTLAAASQSLSGPALLAQIQQGTQNLVRQATNTAIEVNVDATVTAVIEAQAAAQRLQQAQSQPEQPQPIAPVGAKAFALVTTTDPALNSTIPFVLGAGVARGGVSVSPILGFRNAGTAEQPVPPARTLQVAFGVSGQGASQSSNLMVATGEFRQGADNNVTFSGGFGATSQQSGQVPVVTRGDIASVPGTVVVDTDRVHQSATVNQNRIDSAGAVVPSQAVQRPGVSDVPYGFQQTFTRTGTPAGLGQSRPERTLDGFAGGWVAGLVTTLNGSGQVIDRRAVLGGNFISLDPGDSRVQANQFITTVPTSTASGPQPVGGLAAAQLQFGSLDRAQPAQSAYVDYDNFGAREAAQNPVTGVTSVTGTSTTSGTTFSAGNDTVRRSTLIMTTAAPANVQAAFPGVTFCQCEFTRWGFWSAEVERTGPNGNQYSDRIHAGTWVAGQMPDNAEVPTVGTASYAGHMIANIQNGQNQYLAAGNYNNTLNFGTRSGTVSVSNLDGRNYAGQMSMPASSSGPIVVGTLATTAGPATQMSLFGNLYRGSTSPVGEIGGWAVINGGASYGGTGTFAGRMVGGIAP